MNTRLIESANSRRAKIAELNSQGLSNTAIARRLGIPLNTVGRHIRALSRTRHTKKDASIPSDFAMYAAMSEQQLTSLLDEWAQRAKSDTWRRSLTGSSQ